jgi:hypothetical protein
MEHTAVSYKKDFNFIIPVDEEILKDRTDKFLSALKSFLIRSGCRLIGHIKGMVESNGGYLAFSITSFEEEARYKGKISGEIMGATLLLNVIVYGVDEGLIEKEVIHGLNLFHGGEKNGTQET